MLAAVTRARSVRTKTNRRLQEPTERRIGLPSFPGPAELRPPYLPRVSLGCLSLGICSGLFLPLEAPLQT